MKKLIVLLCLFILQFSVISEYSYSQDTDQKESSSLHHMIQGSFSYTQLSGNVDGHNIGAGLNVAFWGSKFSNLIFSKGTWQNIEAGGNKVKYAKYDILNLLRVDIKGNLFGVGALDFEKNEPILIDRRISGFLGAGYDLLANPGHNLSVIAAVGRSSEKTTVPVENPYGDFTSIFLMNSFNIKITEEFSVDQQFDFFAPIDDLERHRIRFSLSGNTTLYKMLGVSYQIHLNYYRDPLVSLSELQKNERLDLTQTIALTVQL